MKNRCAARYIRIFLITIVPVFISRWIKTHPIRGPCNRSVESSHFLKSVGFTIGTNGALHIIAV
jgi:hypothetical protein